MNIALILSGGTGTRLESDKPKQYLTVGEKPIISYCLETFSEHPMIDAVQIVADITWHKYIFDNWYSGKFKGCSVPGANRQLSIYNGLCDIRKYASNDDIVIIHDAARPNVTAEMLTECINAAQKHDGAIPVLPMKDTVYLSDNGSTISSLIPREKLYAGQAPEAFKLGKYYAANEKLLPNEINKINGSTEPAVMYNMDIAMIKGDENNFKITTPADLERFKEMVIK